MSRVVLIAALATGLAACDPAPEYDERALVESLVDVVVLPGYRALEADAAQLATRSAAFCEAPDVERLEATRQAWRTTRSAYFRTVAFGIGPAADERIDGELDFRPTRPTNLESQIASGAPITAEWVDAMGVSAKGLSAIEYLLYPSELSDAESAARFLDDGEPNRRCEYLAALGAHVRRQASRLVEAWVRFAGDSRAQRVDAGVGRDAYADPHEVVSAIVNRQLSVLEDIQLNHLGRPLGREAGAPDPDAVETPYTDHSVFAIYATLEGVRSVWRGDFGGVEGTGFDEYVRFVDPDLAERYDQALATTIGLLEGVLPPLRDRVLEGSRTPVQQAYDALGVTLRVWAIEVAPALDVTVSFTDNDGD